MEAYARRALGVLYRAWGNDTQAQSTFTVALQLFEQLGIESERQATAALLSEDRNRERHDQ